VISPATIAAVRERADLVAIVSEVVPSLKLRGRSYVGLCPFHKEKSPSFHVNRDRGVYHCFGCKESGSAIDFVMRMEGATFPEAVRSIAERLGIEVEEAHGKTDVDPQRKLREDIYRANDLAAAYFEAQLREHPNRAFAWEELARRGLEPGAADEALTAFRIGYAPPGWEGLANALRDQGIAPSIAQAAGLVAPRTSGAGHYDRFRHRLMFTVTDIHGRVVAFSGRALPELDGTDRKESAKYVNSPESPVYVKGQHLFGLFQARHAVRREENAILVEGNFDVVSLFARGVEYVLAPLGTAFTDEQAALLRRFTSNVTLLFDGDAAGRKAVYAARAPLRKAGMAVRVASPPRGKDPDEVIRERGKQGIDDLVASARGMLEFLIEDALDESFSQADAFERAARVERIAKLITEEDDPLVRSMAKSYADHIAGRLDLVRAPEAFRTLEQKVRSAVAHARPKAPPVQAPTRVQRRPPGSQERRAMVGAVLDFPELMYDAELGDALSLLEGPGALIVRRLRAALRAAAAIDGSAGASGGGASMPFDLLEAHMADGLPDEMMHFVRARWARPESLTLDEAKAVLVENAAKLRAQLILVESAEVSRTSHGDLDQEMAAAAALSARSREVRGIKARDPGPVPPPFAIGEGAAGPPRAGVADMAGSGGAVGGPRDGAPPQPSPSPSAPPERLGFRALPSQTTAESAARSRPAEDLDREPAAQSSGFREPEAFPQPPPEWGETDEEDARSLWSPEDSAAAFEDD
jgi:DNA primase